ncbi:MAG: acyl carrier protein [Armatimonadetes bacterium]|nr:acyl carrier protein [Armatimonadota bacterium]
MHVVIEPIVRQFVADNFLFREGAESLEENESLIAGGVIDSTGILELVSFLEAEFNIEIADDELVPDNLDSLAKIRSFVSRKLGTRTPDGVHAANGHG